MIGGWAADAAARGVWLELSAWCAGVEYVADRDTAGGDLVVRGTDVGDDQVETLG